MPRKTLYSDKPLDQLAQLGVQGDLEARAGLVFRFYKPVCFVCRKYRYILEPIMKEDHKEVDEVIYDFLIYLIETRFGIFVDIILHMGKSDVKEISKILAGGQSLRRAYADFGDRLKTVRNRNIISSVPLDQDDGGKIDSEEETEGQEYSSDIENEQMIESGKAPDRGDENFYRQLLNENNFPDTDKQLLFMAFSLNFYRFEAHHFRDVDGPDGILTLPVDFEVRLERLKDKLVENSAEERVYTVMEGDIAELFNVPIETKEEHQRFRNLIKKAKYNACKLLGKKYG